MPEVCRNLFTSDDFCQSLLSSSHGRRVKAERREMAGALLEHPRAARKQGGASPARESKGAPCRGGGAIWNRQARAMCKGSDRAQGQRGTRRDGTRGRVCIPGVMALGFGKPWATKPLARRPLRGEY